MDYKNQFMFRTTRAFTLVEVLVVISIMGVIVAIILPAVQSLREGARRTQCASNLTTLQLGIVQYEQVHLLYPPGSVGKNSPAQNLPNDLHHNWITHVLPYVEQQLIYKNIDLSVSIYNSKNLPVLASRVKLVNCPSSAHLDHHSSDYAAAHHDVEAPIAEDNNGVFFLNSKIGYDDLEDGAANTFFLSEKYSDRFELGWLSGTRATLRNGGTPLNFLEYRQGLPKSGGYPKWWASNVFAAAVAEASDDPDNPALGPKLEGTKPLAWDSSTIDRGLFAAAGVPFPDFNNPTYVGGFGSWHANGVNVAFGDGSVRFVAWNVSPAIVQALIHRKDGQLARIP